MIDYDKLNYQNAAASTIIRKKLEASGGTAIITLLNGCPCRITAASDGKNFMSDKLISYEYRVFDIIVEFLLASKDGRAPKGCSRGRADKVGYGKCTPDTVVWAIAVHYFRKQPGESSFDPVFVLAAVLEWAGLAKNGRGYLALSPGYRSFLQKSGSGRT